MAESNRFYEEELNYLIEAGREYARLHPDRARHLNLSDPRSRDPHVERLVESFAFLSGNIRQKLEDDFPELTHALLDLVWPYHLRVIPSMALLELQPKKGMVRERQLIRRGFLVDSQRTSEEVPCRFRTAYDVEMHPIHLAEAGLHADSAGRPRLRFRFEVVEGADLARLRIDRLRIHLAGEPAAAFGLYQILRRQVDSIVLSWGKDGKRLLPEGAVRPVGFAEDEEVLPYPTTSFPGFRLLSEYFCFPEKFLFLDFVGLGAIPLGPRDPGFEMEIRFRGAVPDTFHPTAENFRLHTTPIVNAFPHDGEPITVNQLKVKHRVLADFTHPEAYEVIAVESVEGLRQSDGARLKRPPFFSFDHDSGNAGSGEGGADGIYYHVTQRRSPLGVWLTYLSLISSAKGRLPAEEVLSLSLTCTNGRLCREVGIGDVRGYGGEKLDFATFRNLTRPTEPIYPRLGAGTEWRFVSQMALNLLSLSDPAAFRSLLALYDAGEQPANRRRIESVLEAKLAPREILDRGAPIRGTAFTLTVDETHFDDFGDLLLFSEVLSEFLSLYSGVNSFTELTVSQFPSGAILRCPATRGKQSSI
ncbi:MAG TPA: type VI secretion system baseplate subunit TssF [Thermoanaerobaculia bacterium]|nr:type VI secretion system baseplate subunit TssF [Thermoanaerobaculia bacterium]